MDQEGGSDMRSLFAELYDAFRRVNGYAIGFVGLLAMLAAYIWLPETAISAKIFIPAAVVAIVLVITLFDCALHAVRQIGVRLPKVLRALTPGAPYADAIAILLLEKSAIFSHDVMVSVYTRADDFERLIGIGFVTTVQENGLIQVYVQDDQDEQTSEIWQRILQNNKDELALLLIKPSIPRSSTQ